MRITLTGRRLAVAAVLVLGGVAAPLAYATIAGPKASAPSSVSVPPRSSTSVPPLAAAMPATARASASTGDNPYQLVFNASNLPNGCHNIPRAPGVDFVLESVSVTFLVNGTNPYLYLWYVLPSNGEIPLFHVNIPITNPQWGSGQQTFNLLIRGTTHNPGDLVGLGICTNGGNFVQDSTVIVTGQRVVSSPSAAAVSDFVARARPSGTTLRWTTGTESQLLGFNVWRYRGAKGVKINRTLIRAKQSGKATGARYTFVDRQPGARRGLTYRLQLVDRKGKRTWYAAFAIASR